MHYYNENDKQLVEWLENLIKAGLLPEGDVDGRSIADVRGSDLKGYTQCHFFAGIGGWPLALELAGWPTTRPVWTGSCPCQPFSNAGRQGGTDDPRHLWPQFQRLINECNPPVVFGEQVASKAGRAWLSGVRTDLEELGYGVGGADLCGASIGSPHIRQRLYWVADTISQPVRAELGGVGGEEETEPSQGVQRQRAGSYLGHSSQTSGVADATSEGRQRRGTGEPWLDTQSEEGISGWVRSREPDIGVADARRKRERATSSGTSGGWHDASSTSELTAAEGHGLGNRISTATPWDGAVWLQCLDNRERRIEPRIRPLADGVPGRVVKLRAYGNAIIPQVGAEFVTAFMETEEGRLQ